MGPVIEILIHLVDPIQCEFMRDPDDGMAFSKEIHHFLFRHGEYPIARIVRDFLSVLVQDGRFRFYSTSLPVDLDQPFDLFVIDFVRQHGGLPCGLHDLQDLFGMLVDLHHLFHGVMFFEIVHHLIVIFNLFWLLLFCGFFHGVTDLLPLAFDHAVLVVLVISILVIGIRIIGIAGLLEHVNGVFIGITDVRQGIHDGARQMAGTSNGSSDLAISLTIGIYFRIIGLRRDHLFSFHLFCFHNTFLVSFTGSLLRLPSPLSWTTNLGS